MHFGQEMLSNLSTNIFGSYIRKRQCDVDTNTAWIEKLGYGNTFIDFILLIDILDIVWNEFTNVISITIL